MNKNLDCFNCDYIKAFEVFATEVQTTDNHKENNFKLPLKFQELKDSIDLTLDKTYEKFNDATDHIKKSFFSSYKSLVDQVMNDFTALRRKFDDYTIQFQQELSEDTIHQKLVFFREECQAQVTLIQSLRKENEQLKKYLKDLRQDNESQYHVMVKLGQEKLQLIKYIEENSIQNNQDDFQKGRTLTLFNKDTTATIKSSKSKTNNMVFTHSASIFIQDQPSRLLTSQKKQRSEQKVGSRQSRRIESKPEIRSEEKNYVEESILNKSNQQGSPRTVYIANQHYPLLDIWRQCVKQYRQSPSDTLKNYLENEQVLKVFELLTFTNQHCDNPSCPVNMLLYGERQDSRMKVDSIKKNVQLSLKYKVRNNGLNISMSSKTPDIDRKVRVKDLRMQQMKTEEKIIGENYDLDMNRLSDSNANNINRYIQKRSQRNLKYQELKLKSQKQKNHSLVY